MSLIALAIIFVVLALVAALAWRTIRFFIKLALVGALLLALLLGFALWRWQATTTSAPHGEQQTSTPARRNH